MQAYVDGSFGRGIVSWGAVIIGDDNVEIAALSGVVSNPEYQEHRQVGGELYAVLHVLEWCRDNNVDGSTICYDYIGIEAWATGRWKANKELTRAYAATVRANPVRITWVKVKAHSGLSGTKGRSACCCRRHGGKGPAV